MTRRVFKTDDWKANYGMIYKTAQEANSAGAELSKIWAKSVKDRLTSKLQLYDFGNKVKPTLVLLQHRAVPLSGGKAFVLETRRVHVIVPVSDLIRTRKQLTGESNVDKVRHSYVKGFSCKDLGQQHEYKKVAGRKYYKCKRCGSVRSGNVKKNEPSVPTNTQLEREQFHDEIEELQRRLREL